MSGAKLASGSPIQAQRLSERPAWQRSKSISLRSVMYICECCSRTIRSGGERLTAEAAGICLDYSKNRITDETIRLLLALARECGLRERVVAMFGGERPRTLGLLVTLYEHSVFSRGPLWNIDSFDQRGVGQGVIGTGRGAAARS